MLSSQEAAASLLPTLCVHLHYRHQTAGKKCGWKESCGVYWLLIKQTLSGVISNNFCALRMIRNQLFKHC